MPFCFIRAGFCVQRGVSVDSTKALECIVCLLYVEGGTISCYGVMVRVEGNGSLFVGVVVGRRFLPSVDFFLKVVDAIEKLRDLGGMVGLYVVVFAVEFGRRFYCLEWEGSASTWFVMWEFNRRVLLCESE